MFKCGLVVNLYLPAGSIHYVHQAGEIGQLGRKRASLSQPWMRNKHCMVGKLGIIKDIYTGGAWYMEGTYACKPCAPSQNSFLLISKIIP